MKKTTSHSVQFLTTLNILWKWFHMTAIDFPCDLAIICDAVQGQFHCPSGAGLWSGSHAFQSSICLASDSSASAWERNLQLVYSFVHINNNTTERTKVWTAMLNKFTLQLGGAPSYDRCTCTYVQRPECWRHLYKIVQYCTWCTLPAVFLYSTKGNLWPKQ